VNTGEHTQAICLQNKTDKIRTINESDETQGRCSSNKRLTASNEKKNKRLPQQQTTDSIHHNLKEEPSALQSLSIFDST
jgi:hypothetical protein